MKQDCFCVFHGVSKQIDIQRKKIIFSVHASVSRLHVCACEHTCVTTDVQEFVRTSAVLLLHLSEVF